MMKQKMRWGGNLAASLLLVMAIFHGKGWAQENEHTHYLSLAEALKTAIEQNKSIEIARAEQQIAEANFRQTDAVFLPQAGVSYTAMRTNNPMNAFGVKLQQQAIAQQDFDPALLNNPPAINDVATSIDLRQPIFNPDLFFMRQGARSQQELYHYKSIRTKEYIAFETEKAYLQLQLATESRQLAREALETARQIAKTTTDLFNQGLIKKSDLLQAQVHESGMESMNVQAQNSIQNASDYLGFLMGQPSGTIYSVDKIEALSEVIAPDRTVPATRADFMAMKKAIDASAQMVKSDQMSYLPKLNAFGSYQFHDKKLTGFGSDSYLAGVQLSWNLFEGNARRFKLKSRRLEKEKLETELSVQKEQSQVELNKTLRTIEESNYLVKQQQKAVEQADEALRILQNRYGQGLATTTDILTAQTLLSQQKMNYIQALFSVKLNRAYVNFSTASAE
jgi:outer membrane protein TolC